jgi:hypothetical protein
MSVASTVTSAAGRRRYARQARQSRKYGEPEQWRFDWERTYSRDEWLNLLPTFGAASQLPAGKLAEKLDAVGSAIDEMGGSFSMLYSTVAVVARRRDI